MLTPAGGELPERRSRELLERRGVQLGNYLNADNSGDIRQPTCGKGALQGPNRWLDPNRSPSPERSTALAGARAIETPSRVAVTWLSVDSGVFVL